MASDPRYRAREDVELLLLATLEELVAFPPSSEGPLSEQLADQRGARAFDGLWRTLDTSHELLCDGRTASQRELYYAHAPFFATQADAQRSLAAACRVLQVPRHALGLHAASRGLFAAPASLRLSLSSRGELLPEGTQAARVPEPFHSDAHDASSEHCAVHTIPPWVTHRSMSWCVQYAVSRGSLK